jgi:hypothetical protein
MSAPRSDIESGKVRVTRDLLGRIERKPARRVSGQRAPSLTVGGISVFRHPFFRTATDRLSTL